MVNSWKAFLQRLAKSRLLTITVVMIVLSGILLQRLFVLQVVKGEDYLTNYKIKIEKKREIAAARGNILDRNGKVLAYNELAYSVVIEDNGTYDSAKSRSESLNTVIANTIQILESRGDMPDNSFNIVYNNNRFEYSVSGTARLRFLADVFGKLTVDELGVNKELGFNEATASAKQTMEYLMYKKYEISKKYNTRLAYEVALIRYGLSANYYQKYVSTTIASDVSEETVAAINENLSDLQGVSIEENTIRKYVDSEAFCHITGYIGKISQPEYDELSKEDSSYSMNDSVGKSGIEQVMEKYLKGKKGKEAFYVDKYGKVVDMIYRKEPGPGNNVKVSIDYNLQKTVYRLLEQEIAGVLHNSIRNVRAYHAGAQSTSGDVVIPIYDVYFALIDNNVVDIDEFSEEDAMTNESDIYRKFKIKYKKIVNQVRRELKNGNTPGKELNDSMKDYSNYIYSMLKDNKIINADAIDREDTTYQKYVAGKISLRKFLIYCISKNWIDRKTISDADKNTYSDSQEVYQALVDKIVGMLKGEKEFHKLIYKYMIYDDEISGRQICLVLYEQDVLAQNDKEMDSLKNSRITAYDFLKRKIKKLEITPAQLALDPCSGSSVIINPQTGEVLACVSYPGYDNNKMANVVDSQYYNDLLADNATPLYDFATQQETAPGSTFKPLSSVAGLMEGVITTSTTIQDKGVFKKVSNEPKCWIYRSSHATHGSINVSGALRDSCNYFFYEVGYRLSMANGKYNDAKGIRKIKEYADLFGLTEKTGLEISENTPHCATEFPVMAAIGQSNNSYTTIGLARYATAIANSGNVYNLTLLKSVENSNGKEIKTFMPKVKRKITQVPESSWDAIHRGMRMVCDNMAIFQGLKTKVAGKTGTAQQIKTRPSHALFIGYAPYKNPKLAIATRIPFGYSSSNAAEVSSNIIKYYFKEKDVIDGQATKVTGGRTLD
ncbi:penicillin-binding protein 2 [Lachnospiraceae bacterium XBB1006]|nr:penicillin-binding protein 2 [Lachnospiraceae bacterium XBB1006]